MDKVKKIKVAYVLSYKDPEYVRTSFVKGLIKNSENFELIDCTNKSKIPFYMYIQTMYSLVISRIIHRPDVYILGFRGHDIYWPTRILTIGKPLIFDEFLSTYDWIVHEHRLLKKDSFFSKFLKIYLGAEMKTAQQIITDTELHKKRLIKLYSLDVSKVKCIYVGADEDIFNPLTGAAKVKGFSVFFYGNLLPLHGIDVILEAALLLKKHPIHFKIIGGKGKPDQVNELRKFIKDNGMRNVKHLEWVNLSDLPKEISAADVCLGGPFGNTKQSNNVITGKTYQFIRMKKPTIIGKVDENSGFINLKNCIEVDQGSSKQLADAILFAYKNPEKLELIAKKGAELYKDRFSINAQKNKLEQIIYNLV